MHLDPFPCTVQNQSESVVSIQRDWAETCLGIMDLVRGNRGGDVEDTLAPGDRGRQGVAIEHVGSEQEQPLRGPVQQLQVGVLGIT